MGERGQLRHTRSVTEERAGVWLPAPLLGQPDAAEREVLGVVQPINGSDGAGLVDHVGDGIARRLQEHLQAQPCIRVLAGRDVLLRHRQLGGIIGRDDALGPGVAAGQGHVLNQSHGGIVMGCAPDHAGFSLALVLLDLME